MFPAGVIWSASHPIGAGERGPLLLHKVPVCGIPEFTDSGLGASKSFCNSSFVLFFSTSS